jgi:preprotein translocase subunit SecF
LLKGFNLGIDFTGGTEFQIQNLTSASQQLAIDAVHEIVPGVEVDVSNVGTSAIRIHTAALTEQQGVEVRDALSEAYGANTDDISFTSIGPTWGKDVFISAIRGLAIFLLLAALFMTIYFRNWRMAISGIVALFHDMIITVGIYALVGWEITPATMIGFLTVIGYSMYDTVVVFDKVRENTKGTLEQTRATYSEQANMAVNQTMVRSINTTVVALLPVGSVLFFGAFILGAGSLRDISLSLFVGMIAGAYSSIFLATPMEVSLTLRQKPYQEQEVAVQRKRAKASTDLNPAQLAPMISGQLAPGHHVGMAGRVRISKKQRQKRKVRK